ncbi:hypothetical protein CBL_08605 [Carabus blaptoides fortunei]
MLQLWRIGTFTTQLQQTEESNTAIGKLERVGVEERMSTSRSKAPVVNFNTTSSSGVNGLYVDGSVKNQVITLLIDTGATKIIMRPDVIKNNEKTTPIAVLLRSATGDIIPTHGRTMLPLHTSEDNDVRVLVADDVTLPGQSESLVMARLDGHIKEGDIRMIETVNDWEVDQRILVGKALIRIKNIVPVRVMNVHSSLVTLKKNTVLGQCTTVSSIMSCVNNAGEKTVNECTHNLLNMVSKRCHDLGTTIIDGHWQPQELQRAQESDAELKLIQDWKNRGERPTWEEIASDRMKDKYNVKAQNGGFQAGNLVWLYNPRRRLGFSPKLQRPCEGPYIVMKRINDVIYRIRKLPKGKPRIMHVNRLALYKGNNSESSRTNQNTVEENKC